MLHFCYKCCSLAILEAMLDVSRRFQYLGWAVFVLHLSVSFVFCTTVVSCVLYYIYIFKQLKRRSCILLWATKSNGKTNTLCYKLVIRFTNSQPTWEKAIEWVFRHTSVKCLCVQSVLNKRHFVLFRRKLARYVSSSWQRQRRESNVLNSKGA